jgi:hypothetical protein
MNFNKETHWVSTDGWRGYEEPVYAVCGANDTGTSPDSPCNSHVAERELNEATNALGSIPTELITCETSNIFCVHHYIIVPPEYLEQAKEIVKEHIENVETRLLYTV